MKGTCLKSLQLNLNVAFILLLSSLIWVTRGHLVKPKYPLATLLLLFCSSAPLPVCCTALAPALKIALSDPCPCPTLSCPCHCMSPSYSLPPLYLQVWPEPDHSTIPRGPSAPLPLHDNSVRHSGRHLHRCRDHWQLHLLCHRDIQEVWAGQTQLEKDAELLDWKELGLGNIISLDLELVKKMG